MPSKVTGQQPEEPKPAMAGQKPMPATKPNKPNKQQAGTLSNQH
jgi:hypothetical protein